MARCVGVPVFEGGKVARFIGTLIEEATLAQTRGKVSGISGAAAKLGIPASTLESRIRSLKINKYRFKER